MALERTADRPLNLLLGIRKRADYNEDERWFSRILQERLQDLLQARRNRLDVLRRYPGQPDRLGVMATPPGLQRDQLRLPIVEDMVWQTISFVRSDESAGPVAQYETADHGVVEVQTFPTKYPHIIIERTDRYAGSESEPIDISLSLRRVQNQRQQTQLNRVLDAASLVFDLLRVVR